ncbi:alpha/beta hydrolase family protein [Phaeobacter sp. C3_T13_0]|uniref:alpha/beta hydrolase family protein n=1 Tax=Phaeobacter cretensis TaxID=3342641 RepID=UPI0039BD48BF
MKLFLVIFGLVLLAGCAAFISWPRPQDPRDRPYLVEQVRFSGGDGVILAGELTMPSTGGPFPAAIFLSGSGESDRDETILGHRPALVLSDHLTRAGYAVLRFDDRGVGKSTGDFDTATLRDFAEDAVGAFNALYQRVDIDRRRIGFIGHSEGGYKAPLAAMSVPAEFMVFLGGSAKPLLPDVMATQFADTQRIEGVDEDVIAKARQQYEAATQILARPGPIRETRAELDAYLITQDIKPGPRRETLELWGTPWGIEYASYDPEPALRAFDGPVLALFGGTDLQVSAKENAPLMRRLLRHPQSKVIVLDGLNHLFQPSETGRISEYMWIDTTIDPSVMDLMAKWLDDL